MGQVRHLINIGIVLIVLCGQGLSAPRDTLSTIYRRGLNTDLWQGGFYYQKTFSELYRLNITETLSSSRLQVAQRENKWKDQHLFSIDFSRTLFPRLNFNLLGTSFLFSDKQSGYVNDIKTHFIGIGTIYKSNNFQIPILFGVKEDSRFNNTDQGSSYKITANFYKFNLGEYNNQFRANYEEDNLNRRKNTSLGLSYFVYRQFYTETTDSLKLTLNNHRRDYYISQLGDIESREERNQEIENILIYKLGSGLKCFLRGSISSRSLFINLITGSAKGTKRERRDFKTNGSIHFRLKTSSLRGDLIFSYNKEDQKYQLAESLPSSPYSGSSFLVTPDNKNAYTSLTLRTGWRFLPNDSLLVYSSLHRFRYDTPDLENFDDRDELRFRVDIQEVHTFSPSLIIRFALNLNILHFVYIYGEKSADNNWTRILRFNPVVHWSPAPWWKFTQSAEVLANYVDYDYEYLFPNIRSFLYRKFRLEDSTSVQLTRNVSFQVHYRLELDETGKLLWNQWLEQKLIDRASNTITFSLNYRPWRILQITPGYTFYSREGYQYTGDFSVSQEKDVSIDFRSHGPMLKVVYQSDRLRFILVGNTIATKTMNIAKQILTYIDLSMSWTL